MSGIVGTIVVTIGTLAVLSGNAMASGDVQARPSAPQGTMEQSRQAMSVSEHVIGKVPSGRYYVNEAAAWPFVVSPDGLHVAYVIGVGERQNEGFGDDGWTQHFLVVDGKGQRFEGVRTNPIFSPDSEHVAYLAGSAMIADDRRFEMGKVRCNHVLAFSPDNKRVACVANTGRSFIPVVVNDVGALIAYGLAHKISWYRFSPDLRRVAYVANDHARDYAVFVNEIEGKHYAKAWGPPSQNYAPVFSPDGSRVAYFAEIRNGSPLGFRVVVDGREEGSQFTGISDSYLVFSPNSQHLLYVAAIAGGIALVVDGKPGKIYHASQTWDHGILAPVFSSDSKHVAYVVNDGTETFVVVDGAEGEHYKATTTTLGSLGFSMDSQHVTYTVQTGGTISVIGDGGREQARYQGFDSGVQLATFSPDRRSFAFAEYMPRTNKWRVVLDGNVGNSFDRVADLVFSRDGTSLAYVAYTAYDNKWRVVMNGQERKAYDFVLAKGISDEPSDPSYVDRSSLHFDATDRLHYLAVIADTIVLVEQQH